MREAATPNSSSAPPPDISVILATRNRAEYVKKLLQDLAHQETIGRFTYEVLVVDNGSTDATRRVVEAMQATYPVPLHYLYEGRTGKPLALNTGMAQARGKLFAFTDDDIELTPTWLRGLWSCYTDERADAITGKILPRWEGRRPAWLTDEAFWNIDGMGCINHGDQRRCAKTLGDCRWVGGNVAIRREAVERLGGFDVRMVRAQDTEYYQRYVKAGLKVVYEPTAVVYHKIGADRLTPAYFRRWRHRTGYYEAYLLPWNPIHLLTVMPLWKYQALFWLLRMWILQSLSRRGSWWERFNVELMLRHDFSIWTHRLQLLPRWWLTVVTGRSFMPTAQPPTANHATSAPVPREPVTEVER